MAEVRLVFIIGFLAGLSMGFGLANLLSKPESSAAPDRSVAASGR